MTERDHMLEPFDALIGRWATEATHPLVGEVVLGSITFEWLEGYDEFILREISAESLLATPMRR